MAQKSETIVQTLIPPRSGRLDSIDVWRGINVMLVISSHLFFGLYNGQLTQLDDIVSDPVMLFFGIFSSVGQMFFFISGCSQILSMEKMLERNMHPNQIVAKEIKKGLFLIFIGIIYDPIVYWHFGTVDTLHMIGLSYIIIALLYRPVMRMKASAVIHDDLRIDKAGKWFAIGVVTLLVVSPFVRMIIGYPIYDPSVEPLVYAVPPRDFIEGVQAWVTTSFFPVFPWLAYFFAGAWCATRIMTAMKKEEMARRTLSRNLFWIGVVIMIAGVVMVFAGEEIAGSAINLPQNEQPNWVVELSFNVQPLTSCAFIFYLGMNIAVIGSLFFLLDIKHSSTRYILLNRVYRSLKINVIFNTWRRFSRLSLTIYILQYAWIPVLRVLQLATGEMLMYSIPDPYVIFTIIIAAWVVFAFVAIAMDTPRGYKITMERAVSWASGASKK